MASRLLLAEQRVALDSIARLAQQDLLNLWRSLEFGDARAVTDILVAEIPMLTTMYGEMAATISTDIYEEIRAEAGIRSRFTIQDPGAVPLPQARALARWGVDPLWSSTPNPAAALKRISGGLTRLSLQPSGNAVVYGIRDDPAQPRYARTTHSGACHFCLMLAGRGAVYYGDAPYFESHDYCKCSAVPIYDGQEVPEDNQRWADEWQQVVGQSGGAEAMSKWKAHVDALPDIERGSALGPLLPA